MTTREDRIHTIKDFLSRPIIISTGLWSSSSAAETQLYTANFPEVLISNAMYQEKLRGFVGLRATLVIKVQVNSQPFQQGRLMLQYFPYAQYMPNRVELVNATLQGRSGCPRTDLDLSVGTEIEMRIPYVSPHVYYNLITGQGSFGAIYLVVYSQLRDQISGTGSVEYTVWAHLEDVDVQYPTGANIFTGSSPNYITMGQKMLDGKFTEQDMQTFSSSKVYEKQPDKIFAQILPELKAMKENGTISSGIGQISEGLSTMSKIPVLGNVFTQPAWISAQASNIFKMLGFSKPTTQGLPCETKLRSQNRMCNFDGADTSHKLALSAQNEIETKAGLAGTSADEMELSHVLSIPNYWDRFSWATNNKTNDILWSNYVTPFKVKPYSKNITDRYRCTHMGYVANSFGYWRGSIVYTFKFVKTQFHSGRLRISFIPFYFNDKISTGVPDVSRTQKVIVDLRTSTEVSFTVPYVSSRPWMYCILPDSDWIDKGALMYNAVTGIVRVEVLNQLVAANNVYQAIDTIVEISGGPDLTFAAPTCPSYVPYSGDFKSMTKLSSKIQAQVMGENEAIPRNEAQHGVHPETIDTHEIDSNWSPEAHCIGEKIMSIRQLIKRFGGFFNINFSEDQVAAIIAPFSVQEPVSSRDALKTISQFEYYYFLYAFWRGSMRVKVSTYVSDGRSTRLTTPRASTNIWHVGLINSVQDTFKGIVSKFKKGGFPVQAIDGLTGPALNMGNSSIDVATNIEGLVEFEVPYYNVSHISPATLYTDDERPIEITNVLKGHIPPAVVTFGSRSTNNFPSLSSAEETNSQFYRAVGDDFSFMYLVGVPPLVNVHRSS
uniref:Capsid polyprotein n=1 Tax=Maanshan Dicis tick virus 1 TaxID=2972097 RepID=A0A9E8A9B1_9VIRU|nr:MAG: capsid polyprotein [Maanshan Dicis tick virus 1]